MLTTDQSLRYTDQEFIKPPHGFCPGCGAALALRYFLKAIGDKVILVTPPGCSAPSISFPKPSLVGPNGLIDVIHCPFGSSAVFAGGIKAALEIRGDEETQVIAWAGDGATFDIGFSALSAAAQRNENIIYVCYDNEAYMNTGNQRSGSTPGGSTTTTSVGPSGVGNGEKDLIWIMMGHDVPYAATATIGYADDLMTKARKAVNIKGFRFFHILTPCVPGWKYPPHLTVKLSKLAVQTRLFPLVEYERAGGLTIRKKDLKKLLEEYVGLQGRLKGVGQQEIQKWEASLQRRWDRLCRVSGNLDDS